MFSLNKLFNHSKSQKQHKKTAQECDFEVLLQKSLEDYRSDVFPIGLLDCSSILELELEKQDYDYFRNKINIRIKLSGSR